MSWRDELNPGCDLHQVLYRDDIEALGCVLRLHGGEATYAYHDHGRAAAPRRACPRCGQERGRARGLH